MNYKKFTCLRIEDSKWVFNWKIYKAQLVTKLLTEQQRLDYEEPDPSITNEKDLIVKQMVAKSSTFLHGKLNENLFMKKHIVRIKN